MNGECGERGQIIEVWGHNLEEEFARIRDVVERFQYIAMDTEFPGIVARPTGNVTDYNYQTVKYNVDLLKVIQLGITFADAEGNLAEGTSTWQFNFRFDLNEDMYAQDSIDFLKQSGIDFDKQQKKGIDVQDFGELIMNSGLVMNEDVKWISFHGCYDFGYLLKLLTCAPLPHSESQFFELLHDFFPSLYDIKYLLRSIHNFNLSGGCSLQKIAEHLQVTRIGPQHQAGSDSLVTCRTFFKLIELYFGSCIDDCGYSGVIYGLGMSLPKHSRGGSSHQLPSVSSFPSSRSSDHAGRGARVGKARANDESEDDRASGPAAGSGATSASFSSSLAGGASGAQSGSGLNHGNHLPFHHGSHASHQPGHLLNSHMNTFSASSSASLVSGSTGPASTPEFVPSSLHSANSLHGNQLPLSNTSLSLLASPNNGSSGLASGHGSFLLGATGAQGTSGAAAASVHSRPSRQVLGASSGGSGSSSTTHLRSQRGNLTAGLLPSGGPQLFGLQAGLSTAAAAPGLGDTAGTHQGQGPHSAENASFNSGTLIAPAEGGRGPLRLPLAGSGGVLPLSGARGSCGRSASFLAQERDRASGPAAPGLSSGLLVLQANGGVAEGTEATKGVGAWSAGSEKASGGFAGSMWGGANAEGERKKSSLGPTGSASQQE
ncbi:CCR4-NOT transcription complex,subunit 7-like,related [Neospora caninum Liverpool]|uniref:poly(A)-specific ribonuclease n=1 Tax=Neospora caninum (strain Liverpool) TaxID=572307 RepID=F0VGP4_NEOCL|nr:CCR4-NOT transcription complex,subunit 7-like,related [Neospora caninum Liverpool]CBZ52888.1 CCR4-NOT transcription complex,subunit 7-like,related [Neospora caninum Liverpool]CEL66870.1 TPA: CCR4-NOT transcription complex,subunit 7-like,related [Neospora caninum Liverpool]|eukprot:XP_003882920.1 CCR4-NOT transcription complex,subunit 7-like,related [Neospora caninum Liverpool]